MKDNDLKVIIELEDKESFYELLAKVQVEAVMEMCPLELRMQVLDNALKLLKSDE